MSPEDKEALFMILERNGRKNIEATLDRFVEIMQDYNLGPDFEEALHSFIKGGE